MPATLLRFGGFELDPANFQLRRSGRPVRLERIPLEALLILVERPGQLVRREEIANRLWGPDLVLDVDNALNTAIRKLRHALHDDPERARYVETVRGKGYRFIADASPSAVSSADKSAKAGRGVLGPPNALGGGLQDSDGPTLRAGQSGAAADPLDGERKQVTALCADVKGAMELLTDRDPEEARRSIDPVLGLMMDAINQYEGTVSQVTAAGLMALFGVPLAQEDHAVRACHAALRIRETVAQYAEKNGRPEKPRILVGIGLTAGEVIVRAVRSDRSPIALGQATHVADRLARLAEPGTVLATADTLRLAEGYVQASPVGPRLSSEAGTSVDVHEVTARGAARTQIEAAAARGFSRFVGRDTEMAQLERALDQARRGEGQVVALVGEPGMGKSRLVFELARSRRVKGWLVLQARAMSYGRKTTYLPVLDLLRGYFKIGDRDTRPEIREKVTTKLSALDRSLRSTLTPLLNLLDVPVEDRPWQALDPPERRLRTLEAVKLLVLREARRQPLLLVFEDLHWIDGETQAFLDRLVDSLPAAPLLLLVDYRPEYRHAWTNKTYYSQVRLDPLPAASAQDLLDALLGRDVALGPLKHLLAGRTDRNPLFLEESVRTLVETQVLQGRRGDYRLTRPVDAIRVPATVQAILAGRIDRLPPDEKRLLEMAAVIGRDVPLPLLSAIADEREEALRPRLDRLQAAELLYQTRVLPDSEYTFKHALTHEVAYGGVLHDRRRALHVRIAAAIEKRYASRLSEHVERLAHHTLEGEVWEPAVGYLRQAGHRAMERSALREAVTWFEQALGALSHLPETRSTLERAFDIRLELRPAAANQDDLRGTLEYLREAERLAERLRDDRRGGLARGFMVNILNFLGESDEAIESGKRAQAISQRLGDLELRMVATTYLEQAYFFIGRFQQVIDLVKSCLAGIPAALLDERFRGAMPTSVFDRGWLVLSFAQLGRFAEALESSSMARQIAERMQHPYSIGWAHSTTAHVYMEMGNWNMARTHSERAIEAIRAAGQPAPLLHTILAVSARVLADLDESGLAASRAEEAERLYERAVARGRRGGWTPILTALSKAYLRLGRLDDARRTVRALENAPPTAAADTYAMYLEAEIAAHPEAWDPQIAQDRYDRTLTLAERQGLRPLVAHSHLGLGVLLRGLGDQRQARRHIAAAVTRYRAMNMASWIERAETERGLIGPESTG